MAGDVKYELSINLSPCIMPYKSGKSSIAVLGYTVMLLRAQGDGVCKIGTFLKIRNDVVVWLVA